MSVPLTFLSCVLVNLCFNSARFCGAILCAIGADACPFYLGRLHAPPVNFARTPGTASASSTLLSSVSIDGTLERRHGQNARRLTLVVAMRHEHDHQQLSAPRGRFRTHHATTHEHCTPPHTAQAYRPLCRGLALVSPIEAYRTQGIGHSATERASRSKAAARQIRRQGSSA